MCQFWKRKYRKKKKECVAVAWKWSALVTIFYMPQQLTCLGMCKIVTLGKKMTANRIFTKFQLCAFKLVWVCELAESESSKVSDKTFLICQFYWPPNFKIMMTSSNGNIFRVTGPLWGGFTGDRWIPLTNASDAELWCFLWYVPEQSRHCWFEMPLSPLWHHCNAMYRFWPSNPLALTLCTIDGWYVCFIKSLS